MKGRRVVTGVLAAGLVSAAITGCGKAGTTREIQDAQTPTSDSASIEISTIRVGIGESQLGDLEDGEETIGADDDSFVIQGQLPDFNPDWDTVMAAQPSTVAYLVIPQIGVCHPILQRYDDQTYYDNHGYDDKASRTGALHLDIGNGTDLADPDTIIYGSDVAGGVLEKISMYSNPDFYESNPFIYVYVPGRVLEYRIFEASSGSDTDILTKINSFDYSIFTQYIDLIYSSRSMDVQKSDYLKEAVVNGWRILTLSAGQTTDSTDRYYVYSTYSGSQQIDPDGS